MNELDSSTIEPTLNKKGMQQMTELIVIGGFVLVWVVLQAWLLPRFGVQT